MNTADLKHALNQFRGTAQYHNRATFKLSEGVIFLATETKAFWLIDAIHSQQNKRSVKKAPFQLCRLVLNSKREGALRITDENNQDLAYQKIGYTDFPFDQITLYLAGNVLMLPSEY